MKPAMRCPSVVFVLLFLINTLPAVLGTSRTNSAVDTKNAKELELVFRPLDFCVGRIRLLRRSA
jgi:hypothetical protein